MIPTVIVLGALLGRWPLVALATAAVGWPLVLVLTGVMDPGPGLVGAAAIASANAAAGVLVHQGCWRAGRWLLRRGATRP